MTNTFRKLNYKVQKEICVVNSPSEFANELKVMKNITCIKTAMKDCKDIEFILTFVKTKNEIVEIASIIDKQLKGDGIVWFAYPKGTSKKYKVEISRDKGWNILEKMGLESVRAIAIDEDWSALRFRRVEFVKVRTQKGEIKTV